MPTNITGVHGPSDLTLRNRHPCRRVDLRLLRRIVLATLADRVFGGSRPSPTAHRHEITILLVSAPAMTRLNGAFLRHAGSTDVITFDYGSAAPPTTVGRPLRGDLAICLDDAIDQAREFGTPWTQEMVRYVVHGLLHLAGYDDLEAGARRVMKRQEHRLVRQLADRFPLSRLAARPKLRHAV